MQLPALALPLILLLGAVSASERTAQTPPPQRANITAVCNGSGNGAVNPPRINMRRAEHIEWSANSPQVASFTITPKVAENWPFAAMSFSGTPQAPAVTPQPLATALENHPYAYNVTVLCTDGTVEVIDPDIIIGRGA